MDHPISTTIVLILAWLIALVAFFAQLRLFAISATLKQIATQIKQILHDIERDLPTGDDCPHCGGGMVAGKVVCRHCGRDVPLSAVAPMLKTSEPRATPPAGEADATCPICGYKYWYRDGVRHCGCSAPA